MKLDSNLLCPKCAEVLMVFERAGVEVDICPKCRGVWLDRGELEKVLENAKLLDPGTPAPRPRYDDRPRQDDRRRYDDDDDDDRGRGRRGGMFDFLSDIFD
jgi:hypothetical protein